MVSTPARMDVAVQKDLNPSIERTRFLIKQRYRPIILFKYLSYRIWMPMGIFLSFFDNNWIS